MKHLQDVIMSVDSDLKTYIAQVNQYLINTLAIHTYTLNITLGRESLISNVTDGSICTRECTQQTCKKVDTYTYQYKDGKVSIITEPVYQSFLSQNSTLLDYIFKFYFLNTDVNELNHDELTKVYSRKALSRQLDSVKPSAVIMLDLDNFKGVNDVYGHSIGDTVLSLTGQFLIKQCGDKFTPYRYGGDEFVILPNKEYTPFEINTFTQELADAYKEQSYAIDNCMSLSIGVSIAKEFPKANSFELINYADNALYIGKFLGKDRIITANIGNMLFYPLRHKLNELWLLKDRVDIANSCVVITATDTETALTLVEALPSKIRKLDFISNFDNYTLLLFNNNVNATSLHNKLTSICENSKISFRYIDLNLECNYYRFIKVLNEETR